MYVVVWSLSKIRMAALVHLQQRWSNALKRSPTLSNGTCVSRILSASVWDRLWPRKGLLLRYTALLLYTQLCCKSTFLSKSKLANRECCKVNLLSGSLNEGQLNKNNERVTSPLNNPTKGSRSLKGVDRLVRLLPFAYAFKSSDLRTWLFLRFIF